MWRSESSVHRCIDTTVHSKDMYARTPAPHLSLSALDIYSSLLISLSLFTHTYYPSQREQNDWEEDLHGTTRSERSKVS